MKPDDFSDQIRRKLESVEPEFREKDWTRMQQALGHSTPVFAIGTKAGLMAAASLAVVMAFGGVAYRQYQANQQLSEQVKTLNQTVTTLRQSANRSQQNPASVPPDTVFLTRDVVRYVAVPVDRKRTDDIAETNSPSNTNATETRSTVSTYSSAGTRLSGRNPESTSSTGLPNSPESRPANAKNQNRFGFETTTGSVLTPSGAGDNAAGNELAGVNRGNTTGMGRNNRGNTAGQSVGSKGIAGNGTLGQSGNVSTGSTDPNSTGGLAAGQTETNSNNAVQLSLLTSRPIVLLRDTVYYAEGMARSVRRMRRLLSTASPSGAALAKVDVNRSEPGWKARIGSGANLGNKQWGAGLFGEIRLDNHWRLGLGLTSMNLKGESFLTEVAYGLRTKQDFRRNFAPGIDSRYDIINITPTGSSWQIPVRISYRFGLGSGWSLVPSAGLNLSVNNREELRFAYLRGPGKIESVTIVERLPQKMLHAGSAAVYLEKNWGDWALQLGPYASTPLNSIPSRLNTNMKTAGASARLFYQIDWKKKR